MKSKKQKIAIWSLVALFMLGTSTLSSDVLFTTTVSAHPGRTDSNGGHHDYKNKSGLGSYHYHCDGYPAHLHENGVCPYTSSASTSSKTSTKTSTTSTSSSLVKQVQKALNKKGYSCGTADGKMGKKTVSALKKFQKDYGLTVDGKIGSQVKKALNLS